MSQASNDDPSSAAGTTAQTLPRSLRDHVVPEERPTIIRAHVATLLETALKISGRLSPRTDRGQNAYVVAEGSVPNGFQVVGRPFGEAALLELAGTYEDEFPVRLAPHAV